MDCEDLDADVYIENSLKGKANEPVFGDYEEGVVMMMYDSVVIKKQSELALQ